MDVESAANEAMAGELTLSNALRSAYVPPALFSVAGLMASTLVLAWLFGSTVLKGWFALALVVGALLVIGAGMYLGRAWYTPVRQMAWSSPQGRRIWAPRVAVVVVVVSGLWVVAGIVGELVLSNRAGFGVLQAIFLFSGLLGMVAAGVVAVYMKTVARVSLPMVGRPGPTSAVVIQGLEAAATSGSLDIGGPGTMQLLEAPSAQVGAHWLTSDDRVALLGITPGVVLVSDARPDSPTSGEVNVVHLAVGCERGCPALLVVPGGVSFAVISPRATPGSVALLGGTNDASKIELTEGPPAESLAVLRNLDASTLVEMLPHDWWPYGRRVYHEIV